MHDAISDTVARFPKWLKSVRKSDIGSDIADVFWFMKAFCILGSFVEILLAYFTGNYGTYLVGRYRVPTYPYLYDAPPNYIRIQNCFLKTSTHYVYKLSPQTSYFPIFQVLFASW